MRGIHQRVIFRCPLAAADPLHLRTNAQHGINKAIQLRLTFGFCRLNHQCAGDRERHGRCMETVINQTLGNIHLGDTKLRFQRTDIQNTFMRHIAVTTGIKHIVSRFQPRCDIVGIQDRHLTGLTQPLSPHHADIHPADRQNGGTAERCGGYRALRGQQFRGDNGVPRHKRCEVFFHTNRPHARSAAAVRNTEGFVQVKVRNIRADKARCGHADLCVHVRAVQIDLAAEFMNDITDFAHTLFIHPVGGRIGDHHTGQILTVLFCFRP